jgi:hypothetical protein
MTSKYEVVACFFWKNKYGTKVSIHGALPYYNEEQKIAEDWKVVSEGFTVYNVRTNTYGGGRKPWGTREEAQAWIEAIPT